MMGVCGRLMWAGAVCALCAAGGAEDLRWSTYVTVDAVRAMAASEVARERAVEVCKDFGLGRLYLEVYRGGTEMTEPELRELRDFFVERGIAVTAGIATVPGGDFGVAADRGLTWFNFQSEKTKRDLERVTRATARVFDEYIVDDFLCTGDMSAESDAARGTRSWADYRRDLMTAVSQKALIGPAKEENPAITMIVKFPQWYDKFHLFGYDVERMPQLYDKVWVGTETRGARTQRYGFVQPYEGFVNYRWIDSIGGEKMAGAWFDYGDCDAKDFVEQAFQTVLAGPPEIILFSYPSLDKGHPGNDLLKAEKPLLRELSAAVRAHPVTGIAAYKPPHSDAGSDLFLMDAVGMLGIPLVPQATFPAEAHTIFLPTQAAADPAGAARAMKALEAGKRVIVTAGYLAAANDAALCARAGVRHPVLAAPFRAAHVVSGGGEVPVEHGLDLAAAIEVEGAEVLLEAAHEGQRFAFLTLRDNLAVLNTHTYTREDYDRVGEVLLPPRPLGLLELPKEAVGVIRDVFNAEIGVRMEAPARVTLQPLGDRGWFLNNYLEESANVVLEVAHDGPLRERVHDGEVTAESGVYRVTIPARSRAWLEK